MAKKEKGKWVTRGTKPYKKNHDPYDEGTEMSVVWSENEHGLTSGGWRGPGKFIIFDAHFGDNKAYYEWASDVTKTMAESLNEKGIVPMR
jgi:hypothetical protein